MKNSSFFVLFLINLASDQLLLLFLLMSAFTWHFRELFHVCVLHICTVCVSFPPFSSIVLFVCLDLNTSCVISASELSVTFSYCM